MSRTIRAKFSCQSVTDDDNGQTVKLSAVYGTDDKDNDENNQFAEATPWGEHEMIITNESAKGFFREGANYYLDFSEAPQ